MSEVSFTQVVQRGCGIDIHRDEAVATIGGEGLKAETRSYKTFSSSLTELKERLIRNGVRVRAYTGNWCTRCSKVWGSRCG